MASLNSFYKISSKREKDELTDRVSYTGGPENTYGWLSPSGEFRESGPGEDLLKKIKWIILDDYLDQYLESVPGDYERKPKDLMQEEYFGMKHLGFAKVEGTKVSYLGILTVEQLNWLRNDEQ